MKKNLKSILVIGLMIIVLFTFTGCGKKDEKEDLKSIIYKDEKSGYTLTFKAPKDSKFEVKEEQNTGKFNEMIINNEDLNVSLDIYYVEMTDSSYNSGKEARSADEGYKEYKWNKYDGYSYNGDKYSTYFEVYLDNDNSEGMMIGLFGSVEYINYDNANVLEAFNSDDLQKFLSSMEFSK